MSRQRTAGTKRPYRPHIRIVNRAKGLYTMQSERWGGHILYLCDVLNRSCECQAGQHHFANCQDKPGGVCKHLYAATMLHEAIERSRGGAGTQAAKVAGSAGALAAATETPAQPSPYGKAAGLLEAFGVAS